MLSASKLYDTSTTGIGKPLQFKEYATDMRISCPLLTVSQYHMKKAAGNGLCGVCGVCGYMRQA
jgi:hypothetical protein